jgi:hypothetical protein
MAKKSKRPKKKAGNTPAEETSGSVTPAELLAKGVEMQDDILNLRGASELKEQGLWTMPELFGKMDEGTVLLRKGFAQRHAVPGGTAAMQLETRKRYGKEWVAELRSADEWYDECCVRISEMPDGKDLQQSDLRHVLVCAHAAMQMQETHGLVFPELAFKEHTESEAKSFLMNVMQLTSDKYGQEEMTKLLDVANRQLCLPVAGQMVFAGQTGFKPPLYRFGGGGVTFSDLPLWAPKLLFWGFAQEQTRADTIRRKIFTGMAQKQEKGQLGQGVFILTNKEDTMGMTIRARRMFSVDDHSDNYTTARPVALVQYTRQSRSDMHDPGSLGKHTTQTLIGFDNEAGGMFPFELTEEEMDVLEHELDCNGASLAHEFHMKLRREWHDPCTLPMRSALDPVKISYMSTTHLPLCVCRKTFASKFCCTKCRVARYCSVACQKADWKRHQKVCTVLKARVVSPKPKSAQAVESKTTNVETLAAGGATQTAVPVTVGCRVVIIGLKSASQHNGKAGDVVSFDDDTGRFKVQVIGTKRHLNAKPPNLFVCSSHQCDVCFSRCEKTYSCPKCRERQYCGEACERIDWKTHKRSCIKSTGDTVHPSSLPLWSVDAHGKHGRGNLVEAMDGMFSMNESKCAELDHPNKDEEFQARYSLRDIAKNYQDHGRRVFMCTDKHSGSESMFSDGQGGPTPESMFREAGLFIAIQEVRALDGVPLFVVEWGYFTDASERKNARMEKLIGEEDGCVCCVNCTVGEIGILRDELTSRAKELSPRYLESANAAVAPLQCSCFSLLLPTVKAPSKVDSFSLMSKADGFVDISILGNSEPDKVNMIINQYQ